VRFARNFYWQRIVEILGSRILWNYELINVGGADIAIYLFCIGVLHSYDEDMFNHGGRFCRPNRESHDKNISASGHARRDCFYRMYGNAPNFGSHGWIIDKHSGMVFIVSSHFLAPKFLGAPGHSQDAMAQAAKQLSSSLYQSPN
jgi:hypothetical protein